MDLDGVAGVGVDFCDLGQARVVARGRGRSLDPIQCYG
jgi:hypothetical protein